MRIFTVPSLAAVLFVSACASGPSEQELADAAQVANQEAAQAPHDVQFAVNDERTAIIGTLELDDVTPAEFGEALARLNDQVEAARGTSDVDVHGTVTATIGATTVVSAAGVSPTAAEALLADVAGVDSVQLEPEMLTLATDSPDGLPVLLEHVRELDSDAMRQFNLTVAYPLAGEERTHTITHLSPETNLRMDDAAETLTAMASFRERAIAYDTIIDAHAPLFDATRNTVTLQIDCTGTNDRAQERAEIDAKVVADAMKEEKGWQSRLESCVAL